MTGWEAVVGLEIHVQLATESKMFCRCANRYGDEPNTNVCPVCLAHPGMLPVANRAAIEQAIRVGLALGCTIPGFAAFDRKNYFYPDSPKAYQISQLDFPFATRGTFRVAGEDGGFEVGITRAHLEEDAAKMVHTGGSDGRLAASSGSVVDFNRVGTPLLEIVTEPDLRTAEQARRFLTLLRLTIQAIGASECDMEKGQLRCDANVSVRRIGETTLGTKTELKNMNSFRYLERGIQCEIERQIAVLEGGGRVAPATNHYDPQTDAITVLRRKEGAEDYRYFPEPDLVPVTVSDDHREALRASLPELPAARITRLEGLDLRPSEALALVSAPALGDWFEELSSEIDDPRLAANWTLGAFVEHLNAAGVAPGASPVTPARLAGLLALVADGTLGSAGAKTVFARLVADPDATAAAIVEREGLGQVTDDAALTALVEEAIAGNPAQVEQFRAGKESLIGFFVGQVMRASGGRAEPTAVQRLLRDRLGS